MKEQIRDITPITENESGIVSCGSYEYTTIPIYGPKTEWLPQTQVLPIYGDIRKYQDRSCTNYQGTDIKWSSYKDSNLLNNGYTMTGNYKVK